MVKTKTRSERVKNIKIIEKHLRQYNTYKIGLMTLKKRLNHIMPNITATYTLNEGTSGTFEITSTTEKYAIDRIESKRALMIHEDIERYTLVIESIDDALNELDDIERKFIECRYIKRQTITQTALNLGYSEKHIFNLRYQVMEKLLISLRGLLIQFDL